jgi:D-amino-acid dehydrogenase
MKVVAVIGGGVVGVATALELATRGHTPVIFERHATIAEEASFGCTGLVAPGWPWPWPLGADPTPAWGTGAGTSWLARWRRGAGKHAEDALVTRVRHLRALVGLGEDWLGPAPGPADEEAGEPSGTDAPPPEDDGLLVFWRRADGHERARTWLEGLANAGLDLEGLDTDTVRAIEPGLHPDTPLSRAMRVRGAFSAVPRLAAMQWRDAATAAGAQLAMAHEVVGITPGEQPVVHWRTRHQEGLQAATFDAVVVCAGAESTALLHAAGWRGPFWLLQGKSVSAPLGDAVFAPRHPVFDADHQALIVAQGGRLRVAGAFAPARASTAPSARDAYAGLYQVLEDWFPAAARLRGQHQGTVQHWEARMSRTRDGLPRIGPSGLPGVWVNMDHGAQGWALAPGSARLLGALIDGTPPPIDATPFRPDR